MLTIWITHNIRFFENYSQRYTDYADYKDMQIIICMYHILFNYVIILFQNFNFKQCWNKHFLFFVLYYLSENDSV